MSRRLPNDWFDGLLPDNITIGPNACLDTTFGLMGFESLRDPGLTIGRESGVYAVTMDVGDRGVVDIGEFSLLNAATIICEELVQIGSHCLISWDVVISDVDLGTGISAERQRAGLREAAARADRRLPPLVPPRPVIIEDVVWIGFGSVITPGVTIGRGSVVACKTVVDRNVPAGVVVAGNPFRIVKHLVEPGDSDADQ